MQTEHLINRLHPFRSELPAQERTLLDQLIEALEQDTDPSALAKQLREASAASKSSHALQIFLARFWPLNRDHEKRIITCPFSLEELDENDENNTIALSTGFLYNKESLKTALTFPSSYNSVSNKPQDPCNRIPFSEEDIDYLNKQGCPVMTPDEVRQKRNQDHAADPGFGLAMPRLLTRLTESVGFQWIPATPQGVSPIVTWLGRLLGTVAFYFTLGMFFPSLTLLQGISIGVTAVATGLVYALNPLPGRNENPYERLLHGLTFFLGAVQSALTYLFAVAAVTGLCMLGIGLLASAAWIPVSAALPALAATSIVGAVLPPAILIGAAISEACGGPQIPRILSFIHRLPLILSVKFCHAIAQGINWIRQTCGHRPDREPRAAEAVNIPGNPPEDPSPVRNRAQILMALGGYSPRTAAAMARAQLDLPDPVETVETPVAGRGSPLRLVPVNNYPNEEYLGSVGRMGNRR